MSLKHYAKPLGGGMTFTWAAGNLSRGLNLKNTGKIRFETLTQNIGGTIGIYGADNPDIITNSLPSIGSFKTTNVGNIYEQKLDKTYPYIVLWSIYDTNGWKSDVRITI